MGLFSFKKKMSPREGYASAKRELRDARNSYFDGIRESDYEFANFGRFRSPTLQNLSISKRLTKLDNAEKKLAKLYSQVHEEALEEHNRRYGPVVTKESIKAKRKLAKLYDRDHKKALKLNKKYQSLTDKTKIARDTLRRANLALSNFEWKELGINTFDRDDRQDRQDDELAKRYSHPHIQEPLEKIVGILSIASFVLYFILNKSITGNVIGSGGNSNSFLLAVGLVFGLVWVFIKR